MQKRTERSLKKRINHTISSINFYSLLVVIIALVITLGFCIKSFGYMVSVNAASHISNQLSIQLNKPADAKKTTVSDDKTKLTTADIFKGMGFSYTFLPNAAQKNKIEKDLKINMSAVNEKPMLTIEYTILKNDKVIYDSQPDDFFNNGIIGRVLDTLNKTSEASATDSNGKELYKVKVKLNPFIIFLLYIGMILICGIIFCITMLISKLVGRMLTSIIVKPLTDLDKKLIELAEGNIEAAMVTEIDFKKPIIEVERLANFTNEIIAKMNEYVKELANQNAELEAQNNVLNDNSKILERMNHDLDEKNLKLKNLFDNVEQGILTVNKDLLINGEYSLQCEKLFNKPLTNEKLSVLIYKDDLNMVNFIDELLIKIFEERGDRREIYISLLPEEANINGQAVKLDYKMVKNEKNEDKLIVIITDITEKRLLEKKMNHEGRILKMVVNAIINREEFSDLVRSYEDFSNQIFEKIPEDKHDDILRQIHTFKGNFSQYEMINVVPKLNELENKLYDSKSGPDVADISSSELSSWIKEDLDIIEGYAGKDILCSNEMCLINKEKLAEAELKIKETLVPSEAKVILQIIKSLSYKSVKDMLKTYPVYTIKLGERLGKNIKPFEITGDDVLVDADYLNEAFKAIVHIFRNAADHGIETEDERIETGKELEGNISCKIEDCGSSFKIIIADDGRGIDIKALEDKLINSGMYTETEIMKLSEKEELSLIFEKGATTKDASTCISGMGIGMSAVKEKIAAIKGAVEVESKANEGTIFTLSFPKQKSENNISESADKFMNNIVDTAEEILMSHMGIDISKQSAGHNKIIKLREFTALLSLKGSLNAVIMISANEAMARRLVSGFMIEKIEENDIINYIEDVLAEISNTIIGAAFGKYQNTNDYFQISIPAVLTKSGGYIKQTQGDILTCNLHSEEYEFNINILLAEEGI